MLPRHTRKSTVARDRAGKENQQSAERAMPMGALSDRALVTARKQRRMGNRLVKGVGPRSPRPIPTRAASVCGGDPRERRSLRYYPHRRSARISIPLRGTDAQAPVGAGMIILDDAPFYPQAGRGRRARLRSARSQSADDMAGLVAQLRSSRRTTQSPTFPFGSPGSDWNALEAEK
jgi:hypothetical protein